MHLQCPYHPHAQLGGCLSLIPRCHYIMRSYIADAHRSCSGANQRRSEVQGPFRSFLLNHKAHLHLFHPIGHKMELVNGDVFRHLE